MSYWLSRNGPIACFNRQRDIVLLDSHSLYALGLYVNQEPQNSRTREFPGLELIQNLATPLEAVSLIGLNNAYGINIREDAKNGPIFRLPGATTTITTSELPDGVLSSEWLAYVNKLRKEQRDAIDPLERGIMILRSAPELTNLQFTQLTEYRNDVTQSVANFFNALQPTRPAATLVVPGAVVLPPVTFQPFGLPLAPPPPQQVLPAPPQAPPPPPPGGPPPPASSSQP
ncbi:hypothetical protein L207DRAFT_522559 [Hyaloscypha variabilis F]|uniref:Uncharacterized protein n=1 Tax=Hyaloscypha variabilis (strain UAMH 11265 / GT02V1 / F) TaxID=1149755 RepID=A0A2J6S8L6_HYAVF|nr:hypothetical protein L207DRAFT_522559 [Hyaloscypha variabilis F]